MTNWNSAPLVSHNTRCVLRVLYDGPAGVQDTDIPILAQVPYGEVLSTLARLDRHSWVRLIVVTDGDSDGQEVIRRRIYRLTAEGRRQAAMILGEIVPDA